MSSLHYSSLPAYHLLPINSTSIPLQTKNPPRTPESSCKEDPRARRGLRYHSDQIRRQAWRRRNEWERMQGTKYGRLFFLPCHLRSRESHGRTNKNRPRNGRATISTPNGEQRNGEDVCVGHENVLRDRRNGVKSDTVDNPNRRRTRYAFSAISS